MKISEKHIQKAILDYLAFKKIFHYRQNSGAFKTESGGYMRTASVSGLPDIVAIKDGIYIGLEVKTATGIQSKEQREIQNRVTEAGGLYFVVRSVDDVKKIFEVKK